MTTKLIGLTRQEVIALMTRENIACSIESFERVLYEAQVRALVMELGPLRTKEVFERAERERRDSGLKTETEKVE